MSILPTISGKRLIRILEQYGFRVIRRKGRHVFIQHKVTRHCTVVPVHLNEDLEKGLLRSILSDLELDVDLFLLMLKKNKTAVEMMRLDRYSH